MNLDDLTFGLAGVGYVLLAKDTALRVLGRRWNWLGIVTSKVVVAHVLLVWALRFDWSPSYAWNKSPAAFLLFHTAFALIVVAPMLRDRLRDRLTKATFCVVSLGVLPAPFRYPEISMLGLPMIATFLAVAAVYVSTVVGRRSD